VLLHGDDVIIIFVDHNIRFSFARIAIIQETTHWGLSCLVLLAVLVEILFSASVALTARTNLLAAVIRLVLVFCHCHMLSVP
jgi:hypothetical protein